MNAAHTELIATSNHAPQIFDNLEFGSLEVVMIDGVPYFHATQCAKILKYSNPHDAVLRHCQYLVKHEAPHPQSQNKTIEVNFIPEADLYRLIFRSKLPAAKQFEHWVVNEVLPSIRKYGMYTTDELLNDPDLAIRAFETIKEERAKNKQLETEKQELEYQIETDKPKVNFANSLLDTKTCIPALDLVKILYQNGIDIGQHRLYAWMRDNGYFIKSGDSKNLPTQKAMQLGLFKISQKSWFNKITQQTEISRKTLVTPKGQMYFINKFMSGKIQK